MPADGHDDLLPHDAKKARLNQPEIVPLVFLARTRLLATGHSGPLEAAVGIERPVRGVEPIGGKAKAVADRLTAVGNAKGVEPVRRAEVEAQMTFGAGNGLAVEGEDQIDVGLHVAVDGPSHRQPLRGKDVAAPGQGGNQRVVALVPNLEFGQPGPLPAIVRDPALLVGW